MIENKNTNFVDNFPLENNGNNLEYKSRKITVETVSKQAQENLLWHPTLKALKHNIKLIIAYIYEKSIWERIAKKEAPIISRKFSNATSFTSFNVKSNIPTDLVETIEGKQKFYMNLTKQEKLDLDKEKLEKVKEFLANMPADMTFEHQQECIAEVLSKVLAYISPDVLEETFKIPDGNKKLVEYKLERRFFSTSKLPYFVFTPPPEEKDAKAWLIVRGSDANVIGKSIEKNEKFSALDSWIADFGSAKGIITRHIDKNFEEITTFLSQNPNCQLAGHSLGGVVQHLAVKAVQNGCTVGPVYVFNSPGVSQETKKIYDSLPNKPKIICFDKSGDFVPSAGRHFIGDHYRVNQGNSRSDIAHREMDSNKDCTLQLIDNDKEENKISRIVSEGLRSTLGPLIIKISLCIFSSINKKDYRKKFTKHSLL